MTMITTTEQQYAVKENATDATTTTMAPAPTHHQHQPSLRNADTLNTTCKAVTATATQSTTATADTTTSQQQKRRGPQQQQTSHATCQTPTMVSARDITKTIGPHRASSERERCDAINLVEGIAMCAMQVPETLSVRLPTPADGSSRLMKSLARWWSRIRHHPCGKPNGKLVVLDCQEQEELHRCTFSSTSSRGCSYG